MGEVHELENSWVLFLQYRNLSCNYKGNVEKLVEINTVEEFWGTFNNIPTIEDIFSDGKNIKIIKRNGATPSSYSFFKKGIEPFWEDPDNIDGFEFSIRVNEKVNNIWINCLLELISAKHDIYDYINGLRIIDSTKGKSILYRIEFWFKTLDIKEKALDSIKENFNLKNFTFSFRPHQNLKEK